MCSVCPCAPACPVRVPCVSRLPPVSFYRYRTGTRHYRSSWAFEHSGLNFDQRLGFCLRSQSERPYSYRTPDNSVFLWSICLFTQCIRNQHFQIFLLQVKGLGVPFRMQVHVLSTWTYPCVVWTRCSHQQFDSWSQLSGLWTVMLHPFGILSVGGFHAATRFMRG